MLSISRVCEQSEMIGLLERTDEDIEMKKGCGKRECSKAREEEEDDEEEENVKGKRKKRWKMIEDGTRR